MGFLRRVFGGGQPPPAPAWPPPGPITSWPSRESFGGELRIMRFDPPADGGSVEVMGESHYQSALRALAGGLDMDGPRVRDHRAVLVPEPDNAYDANAVRVIIVPPAPVEGHWGKVGYLSRADSVAYRPVIDRLAAQGYVVGCLASLAGGQLADTGERRFIGVWLYLGTPGDLMAEMDRDMGSDPRFPS
jgi:hypothetical protein